MSHHPSHGSTLSWDDTGGAVYAAIGQVKDITGPGLTRGTIDVTDHDSSGVREFLAGLTDGGELTFSIGFDPTNAEHVALHTSLTTASCTASAAAWELDLNVCSGTAVWTFDGFVTGFSPGVPVEGEQTVDLSVKLNGGTTLTIT